MERFDLRLVDKETGKVVISFEHLLSVSIKNNVLKEEKEDENMGELC